MKNQRTEAVSIIEEMIDFDAHAYHIVMSKIIRYLDNKDLKNLLRIKTVHCVPKMQCLVRPKICQEKDCMCRQHQILHSVKRNKYRKVKEIFRQIENFDNLTGGSKLQLMKLALKYGIPDLVKYLTELGCNLNEEDANGYSLLMQVIRNDNVVAVKALLDNKADIYFANRAGVTNLDYVCHMCMSYLPHSPSWVLKIKPIMEKFFEKVSNDFSSGKDEVKRLLLNANDIVKLFTVVFGSSDLAKFLLDNDYAVNDIRLPSQQTALHCCIIFAKLKNAKVLMKHKANCNERDHVACTPLYYYADRFQYCDEKSEVLMILLKCTNNLTQRNGLGISVVEHLLRFGNKQTVKTLLQSVIDLPTMKFQFGKSLVHVLVENSNAEVLSVLEELNIPFDVDARRLDGETCLMTSAYLSSVKQVEFLLKRSADVNLLSKRGESAVRTALEVYEVRIRESSKLLKDATKIVVLLLQEGANVFIYQGFTFLFHRFCHFYRDGPSVNTIVAHLTLLHKLNEPGVADFIHRKLQSDGTLENSFHSCIKQIEEIKNIRISSTVTLFKILNEKPEKMASWVRNPEFLAAFNATMEKSSHLKAYYFEALHWRIEKSLHIVNLQNKATSVIRELTGFDDYAYYVITSNIISYLDVKDLNSLIKIKTMNGAPRLQFSARIKEMSAKIPITNLIHTVLVVTHIFAFARILSH